MKPPGKEFVPIRSALAVVSVNPPSEEHDVLRTCLLVECGAVATLLLSLDLFSPARRCASATASCHSAVEGLATL